MTTVSKLTQALSDGFARLPAKQQAVARVLAQEPSSIAFSSAAEVAAKAGVDTATVVRTCQSLGYSGWRELLEEVQASLAARPTFADRVAALGEPDGDLTARIFDVAQSNVNHTLRGLDRAAFDAATSVIAEAGLVVVAAGGVSAGPGEFLTSSLRIIGIPAVLTCGAGDAAPALAPLRDRDVVVGISVWRYLRATVQTIRHAAQTPGVTTVAITDSTVSPAALICSHTLVAQTDTVGPRLGLTGVVALIEALVARVALRNPARSKAAAEVASGLYNDNVLGDPEDGPSGRPEFSYDITGETDGVRAS